jgi:hypothetical protein
MGVKQPAAHQRLRPSGHLDRLIKFYEVNQIQNDEMGGSCSTYEGGERCIRGFDGEA